MNIENSDYFNPKITIGLADPMGAALYNYYKHGELKSEGSSITEGIGQGRITANLEGAIIDKSYFIPDAEAVQIVFQLLLEEGLCVGSSTGVNVAGAIRLAKELGPGKTIVTILCDYGNRYQSKLFNPDFLRSKNLPVPAWLAPLGARFLGLPGVRRGLCRSAFAEPDRDVGPAELEIASLHLQCPNWGPALAAFASSGARAPSLGIPVAAPGSSMPRMTFTKRRGRPARSPTEVRPQASAAAWAASRASSTSSAPERAAWV